MVHFHFNKSISQPLSEAEITTYTNQSATTQLSPLGILNSLLSEKWTWTFSRISLPFLSQKRKCLGCNTPIFFPKTCNCYFSRDLGGRILYSIQIWLFLLSTNSFFFCHWKIYWIKSCIFPTRRNQKQKNQKRQPCNRITMCPLLYLLCVF